MEECKLKCDANNQRGNESTDHVKCKSRLETGTFQTYKHITMVLVFIFLIRPGLNRQKKTTQVYIFTVCRNMLKNTRKPTAKFKTNLP